mmetsp:Transcript_240/g.658  ORF Transcript_240/g.658 Transcript_240/m.658 type:complete len:200 (-) Transcript_240:70-669(-)
MVLGHNEGHELRHGDNPYLPGGVVADVVLSTKAPRSPICPRGRIGVLCGVCGDAFLRDVRSEPLALMRTAPTRRLQCGCVLEGQWVRWAVRDLLPESPSPRGLGLGDVMLTLDTLPEAINARATLLWPPVPQTRLQERGVIETNASILATALPIKKLLFAPRGVRLHWLRRSRRVQRRHDEAHGCKEPCHGLCRGRGKP